MNPAAQAQVRELIVVESRTGMGRDNDPVRPVISIFEKDGTRVGELDVWANEQHVKDYNALQGDLMALHCELQERKAAHSAHIDEIDVLRMTIGQQMVAFVHRQRNVISSIKNMRLSKENKQFLLNQLSLTINEMEPWARAWDTVGAKWPDLEGA